jgi:hypothetical protein
MSLAKLRSHELASTWAGTLTKLITEPAEAELVA